MNSIYHLLFNEETRKPHLAVAVAYLDSVKVLERIMRNFKKKIDAMARLLAISTNPVSRGKDAATIKNLLNSGHEITGHSSYEETPSATEIKKIYNAFLEHADKVADDKNLLQDVKNIVMLLLNLNSSLRNQFYWIKNNLNSLFLKKLVTEQGTDRQIYKTKLDAELAGQITYFESLIKEEGGALFGASSEKHFGRFVQEIQEIIGKGMKVKLGIPPKAKGEFLTLYHYSSPSKKNFLVKGDLLRGSESKEGFFATFDLKELQHEFENLIRSGYQLYLIRVRVAEKVFNEIFLTGYSTDRYKNACYIPIKNFYLANKHILAGNLYFEAPSG